MGEGSSRREAVGLWGGGGGGGWTGGQREAVRRVGWFGVAAGKDTRPSVWGVEPGGVGKGEGHEVVNSGSGCAV